MSYNISRYFTHEELHSPSFKYFQCYIHPVHLYRLDKLRSLLGHPVTANSAARGLTLRGARTYLEQIKLIASGKTAARGSYHTLHKFSKTSLDKSYYSIPIEDRKHISRPEGTRFCIATDIDIPTSIDINNLLSILANQVQFGGIIYYKSKKFIHLDSRDLLGKRIYREIKN